MATPTPDREAIDTFINIAGVSENVAVQKLQEHSGDLNLALDAYFSELEADQNNIPVTHISAPPQGNIMDVDEAIQLGTRAPQYPIGSAAGHLDRFWMFDNNFHRSIFDSSSLLPSRGLDDTFFPRGIFDRTPLFPSREPFVSHPRESRQIPIEVKDSNESSGSPELAPTIEDVTGTEHDHGPEVHGNVTITDDDYASDHSWPDMPVQTDYHYHSEDDMPARPAENESAVVDDDIEELMIREAIEASKHEAEELESVKQLHTGIDIGAPGARSEVSLPPEPQPDDDSAVHVLVRMPDGRRCSRRFHKTDKLQAIFDFIDVGGAFMPGKYRLVTSYPRRIFSDAESALTLEESGLTSKQETLFLETV